MRTTFILQLALSGIFILDSSAIQFFSFGITFPELALLYIGANAELLIGERVIRWLRHR